MGSCSHFLLGVGMTIVRFCIFNLLLQFLEWPIYDVAGYIVREVDCKLEVYANANFSTVIQKCMYLTHG